MPLLQVRDCPEDIYRKIAMFALNICEKKRHMLMSNRRPTCRKLTTSKQKPQSFHGIIMHALRTAI